MSNRYEKSGAILYVRKVMLDRKKMKDELNEHRYFLERKVEEETAHLLKRIALLESCNATLSERLALANKEIFALKLPHAQIPAIQSVEPKHRVVKLCVTNSQAQKNVGSAKLDRWDEHAAA